MRGDRALTHQNFWTLFSFLSFILFPSSRNFNGRLDGDGAGPRPTSREREKKAEKKKMKTAFFSRVFKKKKKEKEPPLSDNPRLKIVTGMQKDKSRQWKLGCYVLVKYVDCNIIMSIL
jgi:hypothetical protein